MLFDARDNSNVFLFKIHFSISRETTKKMRLWKFYEKFHGKILWYTRKYLHSAFTDVNLSKSGGDFRFSVFSYHWAITLSTLQVVTLHFALQSQEIKGAHRRLKFFCYEKSLCCHPSISWGMDPWSQSSRELLYDCRAKNPTNKKFLIKFFGCSAFRW